ncbi:unnamed protein product [Caretta caretta]
MFNGQRSSARGPSFPLSVMQKRGTFHSRVDHQTASCKVILLSHHQPLTVLPDLMDILYEMPKQATDFGRNSISYQRFLFYERKLGFQR